VGRLGVLINMAKPFVIDSRIRVNNGGSNSVVYFISDNRVVKVDRNKNWNFIPAEFEIQKELYGKGYPVPRPYGIFPVETPKGDFGVNGPEKGLFMERIHGNNLDELAGASKFYPEAREIVRKIELNEGIKISWDYGLHPRNIMYDEKNDRIVLIDFGNWVRD
jgi:hypothetical protein